MFKKSIRCLLVTFTFLISGDLQAQSVINDYANENVEECCVQTTGYFALGAAVLPEYDGSKNYQTIPIAAGQINYGNYYIATRGLGLVANIVNSDCLNAGPIINFRFGRDQDVENSVIAELRPLGDAIELGGFLSCVKRCVLCPQDNLELSVNVTKDVANGHDGLLGKIGASYFIPVQRYLRLGATISTDYYSREYMREYFGVDADNAARSGLSEYQAGSGFNSMSLGSMVLFSFNRTFGLVGIFQYTRWFSKASNSPIISSQGTPNQFFAGGGLTYRF